MIRTLLLLFALWPFAFARADVAVEKRGGGYVLLRNGESYFVKGVGGQQHLRLAAESGANSTRTWGSERAIEVLDEAASLGMTATIGYWLDHRGDSYLDEAYKSRVRKEVSDLVAKTRNHPALLIHALGNEINLGADTPEAWSFVEELAVLVKKADPGHPVMTVIAGTSPETLDRVARFAPGLDLVGFNTYRGISGLPDSLAKSAYTGPYLVTEWGPHGHWEVGKTPWGAPLEQSSAEKAATYRSAYQIIQNDPLRGLGSYVFLWGQKQERTPTWYGVFVEKRPESGLDGESTAVVDVMAEVWSGKAVKNRAPVVNAVEVGGKATKEMVVNAGEAFKARLPATDPEGDTLKHVWEVMVEATQLGTGGSFEARPDSFPDAIRGREEDSATIEVK